MTNNQNGWTPIEDVEQSPFNGMLDRWVADGMPVDNGRYGWMGLGFYILMGLVVIGFCALLWFGFGCVIDIRCGWLR